MTTLLAAFASGFALMASIIFAVGPQNAMLLKHGLRRDHPLLIATIFTLCDFCLIVVGVMGIGHLISRIDWLQQLLVYGGSLFLFWFSLKAFYAAWRGDQRLSTPAASDRRDLIVAALAVSLLNPGALIDTLVIVGSVSSQYSESSSLAFGAGAQAFSTLFFFTLAIFTPRLAPSLEAPYFWRTVDMIVGAITLWIGIRLLIENVAPR